MSGSICGFDTPQTDGPGRTARVSEEIGLRLIIAAFACALLNGCYDTKQEITLNPDGTGKAVMESTFTESGPLFNGPTQSGSESSPGTRLEQWFGDSSGTFLRKLIQEAEGVEAWRDIRYRELDDGRVSVRATAYFSDLCRFKTAINGSMRFKVTKDVTGQLTISPSPDCSKSPSTLPATNEPVTAESIRQERKKFRTMQPMLAAMIGTMKLESVFHVPGVVRHASNFETNATGALRHRYDGARVVAALERVLFDPDFTRKRLSAGTSQSPLLDNNLANEILYGQPAPVLTVIKPGNKPLFDYAAEVAAARQGFPSLARELGLSDEAAEPRKPAVHGTPAAVTVKGMSWNFEKETSEWSLGGRRRGYMLSLRAVLPGAVLELKDIVFTRALTVEGLALKSSASGFPRRSVAPAGLTNLDFEVHLGSPPLASKGLAELSGYFECESMENLQTVELFSGRLSAGARNAELGTEIEFIGRHTRGGEKIILRTGIPPERWLSLKAMTEGGQTIDLWSEQPMKVGSQHTYTFVTARAIPRSGRLVAGIGKGVQTIRIPFALTNLSLLGQPLAAR